MTILKALRMITQQDRRVMAQIQNEGYVAFFVLENYWKQCRNFFFNNILILKNYFLEFFFLGPTVDEASIWSDVNRRKRKEEERNQIN